MIQIILFPYQALAAFVASLCEPTPGMSASTQHGGRGTTQPSRLRTVRRPRASAKQETAGSPIKIEEVIIQLQGIVADVLGRAVEPSQPLMEVRCYHILYDT